jgi:glycerophosphoryl diester phosphodiesterase
MPTLIIAHRGASADAPENTMQAFKIAHRYGAHMLELDVHGTIDGEIVVFHDYTTERWNGQPQQVAQLTLAEMQALDIEGERVPTLDEVCRWARHTELAINIEIKAPEIEANVVRIVREHELVERVIVSSFNQHVLQQMRLVAPDIAVGVLTTANAGASEADLHVPWPESILEQVGARAWHPAWQTPQLDTLIPQTRARGFAVYVWTVDDIGVMQQLLSIGVDGIITNHPARLRNVLTDWQTDQ